MARWVCVGIQANSFVPLIQRAYFYWYTYICICLHCVRTLKALYFVGLFSSSSFFFVVVNTRWRNPENIPDGNEGIIRSFAIRRNNIAHTHIPFGCAFPFIVSLHFPFFGIYISGPFHCLHRNISFWPKKNVKLFPWVRTQTCTPIWIERIGEQLWIVSLVLSGRSPFRLLVSLLFTSFVEVIKFSCTPEID